MMKRDISRDIKMPPKQVCLTIGTALGNMEGIRLQGLLREKDGVSGFLSWAQGT